MSADVPGLAWCELRPQTREILRYFVEHAEDRAIGIVMGVGPQTDAYLPPGDTAAVSPKVDAKLLQAADLIREALGEIASLYAKDLRAARAGGGAS